VINSPNSAGPAAGACMIIKIALARLDVIDSLDLSAFGEEIYELTPIDRTEQWPITALEGDSANDWDGLLKQTVQEIGALIPSEKTFILVDQEVFRQAMSTGHTVLPFLERERNYWGLPADDAMAIHELARLRAVGASYLVFTWPCFWWLDHYVNFHTYLRAEFRCVLENDRLIVFNLQRV
jgi:hypothetical protein